MKGKRRNYSVATIALLIFVGSVFSAMGIALLVITLDDVIKGGMKGMGAGIIMPIVFILAFFGFGITALVMGGKMIYRWISEAKTNKKGKDSTARIIDDKCASFGKGGHTRLRYALVLVYNDGTEDKIFTTDYNYDINELRYLKNSKQ